MERYSYKRSTLRHMREIFQELNTIPHETRKVWGRFGVWSDYNSYIAIIDAEVKRLDRANEAVKRLKTEERVKAKFG